MGHQKGINSCFSVQQRLHILTTVQPNHQSSPFFRLQRVIGQRRTIPLIIAKHHDWSKTPFYQNAIRWKQTGRMSLCGTEHTERRCLQGPHGKSSAVTVHQVKAQILPYKMNEPGRNSRGMQARQTQTRPGKALHSCLSMSANPQFQWPHLPNKELPV